METKGAMKRAISVATFALTAVALGGCPIYSDSHDYRVCDSGGCYDCPDPYRSSACFQWSCSTSNDCPGDYVCDNTNRCTPTTGSTTAPGYGCTTPASCSPGLTCGADGSCHTQDCSVVSCPTNYVCELASGVASCVLPSTGVDGGGAPDTGPAAAGCSADTDCSTGASAVAGARCLNGACVGPTDQCTDATQCVGGSQCVNGACTPSCSATKACPIGYACDTVRGVCSGNTGACSSAGQSQCSGADASGPLTCVGGHCVTSCDANNACPAGLVCVAGGCTPDQRAVFTCNQTGSLSEGVKDTCHDGSICLHRSCYITCTAGADGGAGASNSCKTADAFNVCKSVATPSGAFAVCSSANSLGTQCGPTLAPCAAPGVCIDGLCR